MLLVTLLLFVFSWDTIKNTLETTGFMEAIGGPASGGEPVAVPAPAPVTGDGSLGADVTPSPATDSRKPDAEAPSAVPTATPKPARPADEAPVATAPPTASPMELIKSTRLAELYFIRVDDDGTISRHEVKRTVSASDSPMTDALDALMSGPNADELARGYISLIPSETRLLAAQVRGSTAYLDFNEAFMYNRYGIEGYAGQLKQIVYTATGFSTVKDVQILIEGQKRDYLGGDGVYIGKPLSRASF
jgi:spore germination protein GerM